MFKLSLNLIEFKENFRISRSVEKYFQIFWIRRRNRIKGKELRRKDSIKTLRRKEPKSTKIGREMLLQKGAASIVSE